MILDEFQYLLNEAAEYRGVITAIAHGHTISEIAAVTGLRDRVDVVRRALEVLDGLECWTVWN